VISDQRFRSLQKHHNLIDIGLYAATQSHFFSEKRSVFASPTLLTHRPFFPNTSCRARRAEEFFASTL
jgi:hypothetical protein